MCAGLFKYHDYSKKKIIIIFIYTHKLFILYIHIITDEYYIILFYYSDIFKLNKLMNNFQEILTNIYLPLFEVTNDPQSHPELHKFLQV